MMAHGLNSVVLKRNVVGCNNTNSSKTTQDCNNKTNKTGIGSRRIFAPHFKLQVLDSYRNDADCKGNQRATARKYGIHRRQIQKWLQVENTLRNSVQNNNNNNNNNNNVKPNEHLNVDSNKMDAMTLNGARPRVVVDSIVDGRMEFTTPPSPIITPIDLSIKKPTTTTTSPSPILHNQFTNPVSMTTFYYNQSPPTSRLNEDNDAWDLSLKSGQKRKFNDDTNIAKPIKLFKPYLDDIKQENESSSTSNNMLPMIPSNSQPTYCNLIPIPEPIYYTTNNNNNNNIICDTSSSSYTITELQPKSNSYYYSSYNNIIYHPDYDLVGANNGNYYEDNNNSMLQSAAMKQHRHTYSLDFKLSAIDCYYQDTICKGNQRAVATKYNIHRRQVQKWLKQADELRMRNESMKHTVVR